MVWDIAAQSGVHQLLMQWGFISALRHALFGPEKRDVATLQTPFWGGVLRSTVKSNKRFCNSGGWCESKTS